LSVSNQFALRTGSVDSPLAKELISQRVIGNDYADLELEMGDEETDGNWTTKNVDAHPHHRKIYSLAPPKGGKDRRSSTLGSKGFGGLGRGGGNPGVSPGMESNCGDGGMVGSTKVVGGFYSALDGNSFKGVDPGAKQEKLGARNARRTVDSTGTKIVDLTGSVDSERNLKRCKSRMDHVNFCAPKPVCPKNHKNQFLVDFQGQKKLICIEEDTKKPANKKIGPAWEVTSMAKQGLVSWVSSLNLYPSITPSAGLYPWIEDLRIICYSLFHNLGEFYDIFTLNFNVTKKKKSLITTHRSYPKNYLRRSNKSR
jgi:hypothetical protein